MIWTGIEGRSVVRGAVVPLIVAAGMVTACGGDATPSGGGVPSWTLSEPSVRIGTTDGGPDAFSLIADVAMGPDSNIHVLLPQDFQVRTFTPEGDFVRALGREGDGPGEFRRPRRMGFIADTLWVLDDGARRVSFFAGGSVTRSEAYPPMEELHDERNGRPEAVLARSALLVVTHVRGPFHPQVTSRPGILYRYADPDFDSIGSIGVDYVRGYMMKGAPPAIEALSLFAPPFSPAGLWAVSPDGAVIAVAEPIEHEDAPGSYSLTVSSSTGEVRAAIVREYEPIPLPEEHVDSLLSRYVDGNFRLSDVKAAAYIPETFPPVSRLLVAEDGSVWVGREALPGVGRTWDVLAGDGTHVATLEAPVGFDLRLVGDGEVWGLVTDEFDVQYLERRRIDGR